jgi:hypothetical protein
MSAGKPVPNLDARIRTKGGDWKDCLIAADVFNLVRRCLDQPKGADDAGLRLASWCRTCCHPDGVALALPAGAFRLNASCL